MKTSAGEAVCEDAGSRSGGPLKEPKRSALRGSGTFSSGRDVAVLHG